MHSKQVTVGDRSFIVGQAPAVKQKSLLLLLGNKVTLRAKASRTRIDTTLLTGALMSMQEQEFDQVCAIVLPHCVEAGQQVATDVGAFDSQMMSFFTLVAEAVGVNLNDFFTFVNSEIDQSQQAVKQPVA